MILVTLGTQDKSFKRLLEAIDREIDAGNIKDEVVVQAGCTEYVSENMKIFDLIPSDEFDELLSKSDLVITHGGVGSIVSALKLNKKVIAAARLKEYGEHTNNHQLQIIKELSEKGCILSLDNFDELGDVLKKAKKFKPKKFESNTPNMVKLIDDYIGRDNHISWFNRYKWYLLCIIVVIILLIII